MEQTEFTITDADRARHKQKAEAYVRLAELREFLNDDFTAVRRILAGKDDQDKAAMIMLFEPFLPIRAAKERGDRVVFKGKFIVIDGKRNPRAPIRNAVTESEPTPESDRDRVLLDGASNEEGGFNAAPKGNGSEEGA